VSHDPATRDAPPDASPVLRPGRVAAAELLDAVLDATPEVVAVKDRDGRYLAVNAAAARVMGRAPDAIVGRTDDELYPPDVAAALRAVDRRVVDEARTIVATQHLPDAGSGGRVRAWASVRAPFRDAAGRVAGVIVTSRDETERRALEAELAEREQALRVTLDALPTLAWAAGPDGYIDWYNARWYEYTGTTPADMEGWGWRGVHDPAVLPAVLERWAASIASGRPFEMTFPLRGADGRFRPFLTRVAPVRGPDGGVARWIGTNTDVAAERAARERAERLQAVTAALARARTAADVGALFSRDLRDAVGADTCWVGRLTPDGRRIETLGYAGLRAAVMEARWARWPAELPSAARDVLRDGRARWYRAKAALVADYPAAADGMRELDQEAVVVLPLALGEARLGALTVGFRDERDPDPDALAFYEAMAAQCAQALARAGLYEAERTARRRTEELQALTAGLAAARAPDEVGAVVAARGVAALDAAHATVAALDEGGDGGPALVITAAADLPAALLDRFRRCPLDAPIPLAEAARTGRPVLAATREALLAGWPAVDGMPGAERVQAVAALPLVVRGDGGSAPRVVGALAFDFAEPRAFPADEREFLDALAAQCAQALDRVRLHAAEHVARAQAERLRREAEAANRAKSDFLATMSHELRTPLNAIGGYAELMAMGVHGPVTDAQRDALRRVERAQRHLLRLINDVLNFAKLEAGRVAYDAAPVPLAEVVADAGALMEAQFAARGLRYEAAAAPGLVAVADREKVGQVLLNLLSNAAKFTPAGGRVTVSADAGDGRARLRVADTGIGIPADQLDVIFEPFVQVDGTRTRTADGTGLGLAISRDLARGMGGDLTAESTPGAGSTFTLALPAAPAGA